MKTRTEIESLLPKANEKFDVIVAGGGPAGIGAAVASAVCGAKTLLLEARGFFGGVAAVSGWMPVNRLFRHGKKMGGVHELFVNKILSFGPDASREGGISWVNGDGLDIHPDYLRLGIMELLEDVRCSHLIHSPVTGVEMNGKTIIALVCDGKYGHRVYSAKTYIDTTGDGDIAYYAGVPTRKGRESDGVFMPVTLGFEITNVDEEKAYESFKNHRDEFIKVIQAKAKDGYAVAFWYAFNRTTVPGVISVNNGGILNAGIIDCTNIDHVNIAYRTGLQVAIDFVKIVRELKIPGLEHCSLVRTGPDLGIRETRRIEGEYVMTLEDAQEGKEFEDIVAHRYGTIDPGGLPEKENYHGTIKDGHAYPYRCMLPKEVDPLLVAGRCASLTHLGLTTCKSMGNMMGIGQAAGVAAALCAKENVIPRKLDVKKIQQRLREMNVVL